MAKKKISKPRSAKAPSTRMLVVEARFYPVISDLLLDGATRALTEAGAEFDVVTVPGALEIPAAIAMATDLAAKQRKPYDGAVALGCVIQGETFHFDIVAMQSARALIDVSVSMRLPLGNGILTVDTEAQALARLGPDKDHKGYAAAVAALRLVDVKRGTTAS